MRTFAVIFIWVALAFFVVRFAEAQTSQQVPKPTPPVSQQPQKQPPPGEEIGEDDVIRVETTLVTSPALVIGRDGKYVPNLRREDFHIFEDGVEQKLAYFAPVEKPFTVALVIDTSRSGLFEIEDMQAAALAFVSKMRVGDRALVVSFADQVNVLAEPTSDAETLRHAILSIRPGGNTRVYDAVDFVINHRLNQLAGRKAMILFTDGVDTASRDASYESNLRDLAKSEALIYPVQFSTLEDMTRKSPSRRVPPEGSGFSPLDYRRADAYLRQLAEDTGTALHPASDISDLDRAVASIVEELHNEYSLGYYPQTPGRPGEVRRVEVRVNQPQLVVRARSGYVSGKSASEAQGPNNVRVTKPGVVSGSGALPIPRDAPGAKLQLESRWICKGPDVPGDFAVVQEGFDAKCPRSGRPNDETNAWYIRKPGPSEILCKGFLIWNGREVEGAPIPTGYAVVGQVVAKTCAASNDKNNPANAWTVKLPVGQETACKGFAIPRGYVVINEKRTLACPVKTSGENAWVIAPKWVEQ